MNTDNSAISKSAGSGRKQKVNGSIELPVKPESLTKFVHDAIRNAIVDKTLPPGSRVTEANLAQQLNVSKTPVREALMELRQAGLIEDWGRRGGRVILPARRAIQEVAETREAVDVFLTRAAAERASDAQIEAIQHAAQRTLDEAVNDQSEEFQNSNLLFHRLVAEVVGNDRLAKMQKDALLLSSVLRLRDLPPEIHYLEFAEGHLEIASRIAARDPDGAARAARAHVHCARDYSLSSFDHVSERNGGTADGLGSALKSSAR